MLEKELNLKETKARISDIKITGVTHTSTEYIKNQFKNIFEATNFYDLIQETDDLRDRLLKLGVFKDVEILVDKSKSEKAGEFDILIGVEEKNLLGGGIHTSIGNNDGSVNTNVSAQNLFGKGEKVGCEYAYGTNNHIDYRVYYTSQVQMNPNKQLTVSGFRSSNDFSWSKYKQHDNGIGIDYTTPFSWLIKNKFTLNGVHTFSYEGIWRELISSLDSAFDVRKQSGHSLKSSIKYVNTIDKRDHPILPTSGAFLKTSAELAGLGGDVQFFKTNFDYQISKTFLNYFTTQLTVSKGLVLPWKNKNVAICDKFFLGGPLSLRGFTNKGAGMHKEECALGDTAYWLMGAHLYTPLPFLHNQKKVSSWLKTHSFINMGNMVAVNDTKSLSKKNLFENTRLTIGSGVVIAFGGMARLELNYVYPLWKNKNDKSVNGLQFGIGVFFN